jgi:hypothetical protein
MVTAVAKRDGKIFYYSKPFYEHQLRRNRYKIPRKEYQLIESEEELLKLFNASNENMAVNR